MRKMMILLVVLCGAVVFGQGVGQGFTPSASVVDSTRLDTTGGVSVLKYWRDGVVVGVDTVRTASTWDQVDGKPDSIVYSEELNSATTLSALQDTLILAERKVPIPLRIPTSWNMDKLSEFTREVRLMKDSSRLFILKIGDSNTNSEEQGTREPYQEYFRSLGYENHPETLLGFNDGLSLRFGTVAYRQGDVTRPLDDSALSRHVSRIGPGGLAGMRVPYTVTTDKVPDTVRFILKVEPTGGTAKTVVIGGAGVKDSVNVDLSGPVGIRVVDMAVNRPTGTQDYLAYVEGVTGSVDLLGIVSRKARSEGGKTIEYSSVGVGGSQAFQWQNQFKDTAFMQALRAVEADMLQIQLGSNDSANRTCEQFRNAYRTILDSAQVVFGKNLLLIAPPRRFNEATVNQCGMEDIEAIIFDEAYKRELAFMSLLKFNGDSLQMERDNFLNDVVHWGERGHRRHAEFIMSEIVPDKLIPVVDEAAGFQPEENSILYSGDEVRTSSSTAKRKQWAGTNNYTYTDVYRFTPSGTGLLAIKMPEDPAGNLYAEIRLRGYRYGADQGNFDVSVVGLNLNSNSSWINSYATRSGSFSEPVRLGNHNGIPCVILGSNTTVWSGYRWVEVYNVITEGPIFPPGSSWTNVVESDISSFTGVATPFLSSPAGPAGYAGTDGLTYTYNNVVNRRLGGNYIALKIPIQGSADRFDGEIIVTDYTAGADQEQDVASVRFTFFGQSALDNLGAIITGEIPGQTVQFGRIANDYYVIIGDGSRIWSSLSLANLSRLTVAGNSAERYSNADISFESLTDLTGISSLRQVNEVIATSDGMGDNDAGGNPITNVAPPTNPTDAARLADLPTILTGSSTLDFPSVAAMSHDDLTVTVTGAVVGDAIALGAPHAAVETNMTYFAWVSSSNTVTVRALNHNATPIDPTAGTFNIKIIQ